jgi:hypothetical protein
VGLSAKGLRQDVVVFTEAEQAVFDHIVAEPGPVLWAGPPSPAGWMASVSSGGVAGAVPATVQFRKSREFSACQLHSVTFDTREHSQVTMILRAWPEPGGTWAVCSIGGGGPGPHRSEPWVNFAAQLGADSFAAGGDVIGDGAEQAHRVRLTFAGGVAVEDTVDGGVVLFFTSPGVACPARVEIFSDPGAILASYDEFADFA